MPTEEDMITRHEPLIRHLAARFLGRGVECDDLVQEGLLGLVIAVRTYDPSRGTLSSWIGEVAKNRMRDLVRTRRRQQRTTLLEEAEWIVDSSPDAASDGDLWDALSVVRRRMTFLQRRVFFCWLGIGHARQIRPMTITAITRRYRIARQKVCQIIAYGLQLCRDCLGIDCDLRSVRIARARQSIAG